MAVHYWELKQERDHAVFVQNIFQNWQKQINPNWIVKIYVKHIPASTMSRTPRT